MVRHLHARAHAALATLALSAAPALAQVPSFPAVEELEEMPPGTLVLRRGTYGDSAADWGWLLVPERRSDAESRLTRLALVRQPATGERSEPPLFNLVGGPGASNVFGSGEVPLALRQSSDVVRVGYRGIDGEVELRCPEFARALQGAEPLSQASIERARAALRACHERYLAAGVDLGGYGLLEVVEDIEAARLALGEERIDVLAVSWGTQIALAYCARHPERVRRMLLVGAGGRARGFDLWDPAMVEEKLRRWGELWSEDPAARARSEDIRSTIRAVLEQLPRDWNGVRIEPDKVRLGLWHMLRSVTEAAQALDAFASAEDGEWGGLALLSWGYDEEQRRSLGERHGEHFGEFFAKATSTGLDLERDWIADMEPEGALLGSPAARLLWGAASRGGWPADPVPQEFRRDPPLAAETLILSGSLDFASPHEYVERELLPQLEHGHLVVLPEMGHTDVVRLQPQAFDHAAVRFFRHGEVDTSRFVHQPVDFTPEQRLQDLALELLGRRGR
jgi:pimeloyl-ACP methyl ester carboxylesterase